MTPTLEPLVASERIVAGYRRYLRSLLPLRDPALAFALDHAIDTSPLLTKGPLVEATPAYAPGATIRELVADGMLDETFLRFTGSELPADRPLYLHQEQAVRKIAAGRNVVVATGTGSGKTESFLLPVLSRLADESVAGTLGPGVRALLLYPMNALANDQMKRLRRLLADVPEVTFGRYTGETRETSRQAEDMFARLHPGEPVLPNELLSREGMRRTPPHLLLTNYAMLEYLLLRPQDIELFEGNSWQFIVVDEAHVYDGAKGAEMAMLLRRLRQRVGAGEHLQAIATSATVGAKEHPAAATRFAADLFGLRFEWHDTDPQRQDIVTATVATPHDGPVWGPLPAGTYRELLHRADVAEALPALARDHGWDAVVDTAGMLRAEARVAALRTALRDRPRPLADLAAELMPGEPRGAAALTELIQLAARTTDADGSPVLSARFHLFVRATEGAFSCLGTEPHLNLSPHEQCEQCSRVTFELGGCRRCGAVHLHGRLDVSGRVPRHVPWRSDGTDKRHTWLLLDDAGADRVNGDEDDALHDDTSSSDGEPRLLCVGCGSLHAGPALSCGTPRCPAAELRPVLLLPARSDELRSCGACGARGPRLVRLLESGGEAAASVLGSALYQELPPDDGGAAGELPGQGRKLLFFSDSRQMAAYFAPYLQDTHERLLQRRLVTMALSRLGQGEPATVEDLVEETARIARGKRIFHDDTSARSRRAQAALWVAQELVAFDDRQSLEGVGLLRVDHRRPDGWSPPASLAALGLDVGQSWGLLHELLRNLRSQGAVTMPDEVDHADEAFSPRLGPIYVRGRGSEPKRKVLSWQPTVGTNGRVDYVARVLRALGSDASAAAVLAELWEELDPAHPGAGPRRWFWSASVGRLGVVRRLDACKLLVRPVAEREEVFRCDRCRRIAPVSVLGVCPTLRCTGRLGAWRRPSVAEEREHYRHLYVSAEPVPLSVQEHTAQWTSERAAEIQGEFVRGEVNALSCSTTFELGVDVGDLQAVVLRNMPPTTANYVQRAGRAGRRTESAALVLTYAQRRSHDLTRFAEPEAMIAGQMRAPIVPLENVRIDRRHAHSVVLAAFFRLMATRMNLTWRTAGEFYLPPVPTPPDHVGPVERLTSYLASLPRAVRSALEAVLPPAVQKEIGVVGDEWVPELIDLVRQAGESLATDVAAFEARLDEAAAKRQFALASRCQKVVNTLRTKPLLNYLATRNVLPKYGFPVDTVELRTDVADSEVGRMLELTRDLSMAVNEYAPGAQVVAGGRRWTSGGVYRLPGRELVDRYYIACSSCGHYRQGTQPPDPLCPACQTMHDRRAGHYVVPAYGFVATKPEKQGATQAPRRSWSAATYIVDVHADVREGIAGFAGGREIGWRAGARGEFVVVNEGAGKAGFVLCEWCGWGASALGARPRDHEHLLKGGRCTGPLHWHSLAHGYETDFVELEIVRGPASRDAFRSAVYALLEGAAEALEISRDDIDGAIHHRQDGTTSIVLFDTTPGGAGNTIRIAERLVDVVTAAVRRIRTCECGAETSCYGCLRAYRNERYHEELSRHAALALLSDLVPEETAHAST